MEWYNKEIESIKNELNTDIENGILDIESAKEKYGFNEIKSGKKKSNFQKFIEQFKDFMIIVLIIAAVVSGIVGIAQGEGITDTIIILIVVIVNAIIGVVQENKAEKSLEALQKLSSHVAKVVRNGKMNVIPARELVPGDIVILDTGDFVPADLRLIEAINLKVQESALTGESVPVEKNIGVINGEVGLGDRTNMLYSSSLITYGRGKAIVVETGMNTEVGKIANMIESTEKQLTPLQIKLNKLGKTLGLLALGICAFIFIVGLLYGKNPISMFMTAVSLAVAAIPEGLAAVSTIVLAIGVQRMVKKNSIVKKLPAVETLGSATVICSDKTGTLTQNKMTCEKIYVNDNLLEVSKVQNSEVEKLIYACVLCNDSKVDSNGTLTGDPTETALIDLALELNYNVDNISHFERVDEIPFDSERKLMTTVNNVNGKFMVYTKGGVDELLSRCNRYEINNEIKNNISEFENKITKENENMAQNALRVLAFGYKEFDHKPSKDELVNIESNLIFVGLVGMIDPPREEVKSAVEKCKTAGIKPVMITGDHKITAIAIAKKLGILNNEEEALTGLELEKMSDEDLIKNIRNYSVYARVSPEHKVRIVKAWQENGEVVAMTGDGVNDAPALKTANIGCAMGIVGTDVSKEAADVILTDDNFATIVSAVEEGRRIYDNILKAIQFLLSSNIGEIITLFVAIIATPLIANWFGISNINALVPLLPIHILWINLVTDSLPALALAIEPPAKDIMNRKPLKNKKGIFTKGMTLRITYQGFMIAILTLIAFCLGLSTKGVDEITKIKTGQTMAFTVLALLQLVHVFNIKNNKESLFKTGILNNTKLILASLLCATLMIIILIIPGLREIFSIAYLPTENILEIILLLIAPIIIVELMKLFKLNTTKDE